MTVLGMIEENPSERTLWILRLGDDRLDMYEHVQNRVPRRGVEDQIIGRL